MQRWEIPCYAGEKETPEPLHTCARDMRCRLAPCRPPILRSCLSTSLSVICFVTKAVLLLLYHQSIPRIFAVYVSELRNLFVGFKRKVLFRTPRPPSQSHTAVGQPQAVPTFPTAVVARPDARKRERFWYTYNTHRTPEFCWQSASFVGVLLRSDFFSWQEMTVPKEVRRERVSHLDGQYEVRA